MHAIYIYMYAMYIYIYIYTLVTYNIDFDDLFIQLAYLYPVLLT